MKVNYELPPEREATPQAQPLPKLGYTSQEAAQILGMKSKRSIERLILAGRIRPISGFRHTIIPMVELERFIREAIGDGGTAKSKKARPN
jgi:hypothetical protein